MLPNLARVKRVRHSAMNRRSGSYTAHALADLCFYLLDGGILMIFVLSNSSLLEIALRPTMGGGVRDPRGLRGDAGNRPALALAVMKLAGDRAAICRVTGRAAGQEGA